MAQEQVVSLLFKLFAGQKLNVNEIADEYGVTVRTAQRFLTTIKNAIDDSHLADTFELTRHNRQYALKRANNLSEAQLLVLAKILLASRSLNRSEMNQLVRTLISELPETSSSVLSAAIGNEQLNYREIGEKQDRLAMIWQLQETIQAHRKISFLYMDKEISEQKPVTRVMGQPVAIRHSQYYFFVTVANDATGQFETYRIDWMAQLKILGTRSEFGVFREYQVGEKQIEQAYAYDGHDIQIQFEYYGLPDYVLDRFPKSRVIKTLDKPRRFDFPVTLMEITVEYSLGIKMWLMTQSNILRVLKPQVVVDDVKDWLAAASSLYADDE